MVEIKKIYNKQKKEKLFYWDAPDGHRLSMTKPRKSLLSDSDIEEILLEHIEEYLDAQGLSIKNVL